MLFVLMYVYVRIDFCLFLCNTSQNPSNEIFRSKPFTNYMTNHIKSNQALLSHEFGMIPNNGFGLLDFVFGETKGGSCTHSTRTENASI